MKNVDYVGWGTTTQPKFARLELLDEASSCWELNDGVSVAGNFLGEKAFGMNPKHKKNNVLGDAVGSVYGDGVPIISEKMRQILASFSPQEIEFLPLVIFGLKGEITSTTHTIANTFHVVDALDQDQMDIVWNPMDRGSIVSTDKVVLDPSKLETAPPIFRPKFFECTVLLRRDVANAILASGAAGIYFQELSEIQS